MEELLDFLADVFGNVCKKVKINAVLVLTGGILSSLLFIPYLFKLYPVFSFKYALIRIAILLVSFLFIKVFILTIKEVKINFNTVKALFQDLLNPAIFSIVLLFVYGALIFTGVIPLLFPDFTEKHTAEVFGGAILGLIAGFILFPNAIISLILTYEGHTFKEAIIESEKVLSQGRGKMYSLTFCLLLCALVLNLTVIGMIIVVPLIFLSMDQARESLITIAEEKTKAAENAKKTNHYRPKVDYTKVYPSYDYGVKETKNESAKKDVSSGQTEPSKESLKPGLGNVFKASSDGKKPEDAPSKTVSTSVYEAPPSSLSDNKEEEHISLSDILDIGVYEDNPDSKEFTGIDGKEGSIDVVVEEKPEVEIYREKQTKKENVKEYYKSGKDYIDNFGTIKRKAPAPSTPEQKQKRTNDAKSYIDNFGVIKAKK